MTALKWNYDAQEYDPYELPEGVELHPTANLTDKIVCASCGKSILYRNSYNSLEIHNEGGFGYLICAKCADKEIALFKKNRKGRGNERI